MTRQLFDEITEPSGDAAVMWLYLVLEIAFFGRGERILRRLEFLSASRVCLLGLVRALGRTHEHEFGGKGRSSVKWVAILRVYFV